MFDMIVFFLKKKLILWKIIGRTYMFTISFKSSQVCDAYGQDSGLSFSLAQSLPTPNEI